MWLLLEPRDPSLGSGPITDVTASDISQLAEHVKATVVQRRNARGGRGAAEHLIAAFRCMYKYAVADGILTESQNPAAVPCQISRPVASRSGPVACPCPVIRPGVSTVDR